MRIKVRTIIALLLALVMALSLAACGRDSDSGSNGGNNGGAETPEYVYTAEFSTLSSGERSSINPRAFTEEGFYASSYEKVGENIPEGVTPEYEGQYDIYEDKLYFIGFDGSKNALPGYKPMEPAEDGEDKKDFSSSTSLQGIVLRDDGNLVTIESVYSNWSEAPEGITQDSDEYWSYYQYNEEYYIRVLDENGAEISRANIPVEQDSYLNTYNLMVDEAGNLLVTGDTAIRAIASDGSTAYSIESDSYIDNLVKLRDGRVGALKWGDSGMSLSVLDPEAKSFGEDIPLPYDAYNLMSGGGDYDVYYTSGINLFGYNIETQESEKLLNWINCDIDDSNLNGINIMDDGRIVGIINTWDSEYENLTIELAVLSKVPYESVTHKETLTLAVMNLDWNLRGTIIDFNRKSDKYRIEVNDYSEYNTEDDYEAGLTKLTTEIMAGNMPDILSLSQMPYEQLAAKGLLEDLYPYLDADSELDRDDFFSNVLGALEVDGKLCQVAPSFSILTAIGASSVVGDTPGWTYEQFNAALASMPEGCTPFDTYTTRDSILQLCLYLDMENFVDWSTGQCNFDSQEFIDLLNFSMLFPESFDWDNYDWSQEESTESRIAQGKQMLMQASIYNFNDIQFNDFYFGGDSTYIGFPTSSGVGNVMFVDSGLAMSSSCSNKEAAWQFMRTLLTDDFQADIYGMPLKISAYNANLEIAMTPQYQTDGEGNYVLDENGDRIEMSTGGMGSSDGTTYEFYAITQEQADKLWDLISSTTKVVNYNESIFDIVNEQAQAFFSGQKPAEEVAKLVQNMANIYVNEQR